MKEDEFSGRDDDSSPGDSYLVRGLLGGGNILSRGLPAAGGRGEWTRGRPVDAAPHLTETLPNGHAGRGGAVPSLNPGPVLAGFRRVSARLDNLWGRAGAGVEQRRGDSFGGCLRLAS